MTVLLIPIGGGDGTSGAPQDKPKDQLEDQAPASLNEPESEPEVFCDGEKADSGFCSLKDKPIGKAIIVQ